MRGAWLIVPLGAVFCLTTVCRADKRWEIDDELYQEIESGWETPPCCATVSSPDAIPYRGVGCPAAALTNTCLTEWHNSHAAMAWGGHNMTVWWTYGGEECLLPGKGKAYAVGNGAWSISESSPGNAQCWAQANSEVAGTQDPSPHYCTHDSAGGGPCSIGTLAEKVGIWEDCTTWLWVHASAKVWGGAYPSPGSAGASHAVAVPDENAAVWHPE